jgi:hypothetical protein
LEKGESAGDNIRSTRIHLRLGFLEKKRLSGQGVFEN